MWMWRSWSRMLCLAGGLWAVGCTDYGTYSVSWTFPPVEPAGPELAATGCGKHGVDSLRVTGMSTEGDGEDVSDLVRDRQFRPQRARGDLDLHGAAVRRAWQAHHPDGRAGLPGAYSTAAATIATDRDTPLPGP